METNQRIDEIRTRRALQPPAPWRWESDKLIAADGTVILWAVADCYGKKYIGAQADCDDFIEAAPDDIDLLLAEIDRLRGLSAGR